MRTEGEPIVVFEQIILDKIAIRRMTSLSPYVLRSAQTMVIADRAADRLVARVDAHVLGQDKTATREIVERPVYPTWRHHLVDSLPEGFRRRFLMGLWDLTEPLGVRRRHRVTTHAIRAYPEADISPPEFGTPVLYAQVDDDIYGS